MFTKILVPLDGSQLAEQALEPAISIARHSSSELILLRAPDSGVKHVGAGARASEEARNYLEGIKQTSALADLQLRNLVISGDAAGMIIDTAVAEPIDLIVMSSHGRSGISRWVYGSVAERVIRHAPCPVIVIRSRSPLRRMLIPLDGSALSERVFAPGLAVAMALGCDITLLHALYKVRSFEETSLEKTGSTTPRLKDSPYQEACAYLHDLATSYQSPALKIQSAVREEPAANCILTFAEEHHTDLIAMSTHGRTGLQRWLFGSVTEKVLRKAPGSMLIVRPSIRD